MHYTLHPIVNASCLYLPKLGEERRLFTAKKAINTEERDIHLHVRQSHQRPWKTVWGRKTVNEVGTPNKYKGRRQGGS